VRLHNRDDTQLVQRDLKYRSLADARFIGNWRVLVGGFWRPGLPNGLVQKTQMPTLREQIVASQTMWRRASAHVARKHLHPPRLFALLSIFNQATGFARRWIAGQFAYS
jgi:hypothetical protein